MINDDKVPTQLLAFSLSLKPNPSTFLPSRGVAEKQQTPSRMDGFANENTLSLTHCRLSKWLETLVPSTRSEASGWQFGSRSGSIWPD